MENKFIIEIGTYDKANNINTLMTIPEIINLSHVKSYSKDIKTNSYGNGNRIIKGHQNGLNFHLIINFLETNDVHKSLQTYINLQKRFQLKLIIENNFIIYNVLAHGDYMNGEVFIVVDGDPLEVGII